MNIRNYAAYLAKKRTQYGEKFDDTDLAPQFIPFYNSGIRIRVMMFDEEITGTIGITGGWKPCFLLMRTSRSLGSVYTLRKDDTIVAVQHGKLYVQLEKAQL